MFHIGHLNILKAARELCDFLIVGVSTDKLATEGKGITLVSPYADRCAIVSAIKYVDKVVPQESYDKLTAWSHLHFHRMFVGDDWKGTDRWLRLEAEFATHNVQIIYLPYTHNVSSTKLRKFLDDNYEAVPGKITHQDK